MVQETFNTTTSNVSNKIKSLIEDGWTIITTIDTSSPISIDAHGAVYGGSSVSIIAQKETKYKDNNTGLGRIGFPRKPGPGGR